MRRGKGALDCFHYAEMSDWCGRYDADRVSIGYINVGNAMSSFRDFRAVVLAFAAFGTAAGAASNATRPAALAQYHQWRRQIKQALFIEDHLPALAPKSFGTFSPAEGVVAERMTFATSYGMRVPAIATNMPSLRMPR